MKITATLIRETIQRRDAKGCVMIAEALRIGYGMNYSRIHRMVSNLTGIDVADWDELLREGEG